MDVHRKRSQVASLDQAGDLQRNRNLPNDPAELSTILGALPAGTPVAFEAAYGWGWLVDLLDDLELEPHLVHPSRCKAIASARVKNDKVDAETLAQLLRADLLPEAWIAPEPVRDLRALLRHRVALVRWSTALKNRVHAVLADRGVAAPCSGSLWTAPGRAWLAALDLPLVPHAIIDDCCERIDTLATPDRPAGAGDHQARQARPAGGGAHGLGGAYPSGAQLATARSATATSPSRARYGCAGSSREAAQRARPSRRSPAPTPRSPTAAAGRSPPWRSPASCWPAAFTFSPSWRSRPQEGATTGRARVSACACNTAVELIGAARPGLYRHADPTRARMGACQTNSDRGRAGLLAA
jgi:Transposase